ncbi:MAG TPA: hypothetical protein VJ970_06450, partial [Flavobacteriaceae bacterium]|nr:hypothetical protein [Flavobacteriaceae bacterium]
DDGLKECKKSNPEADSNKIVHQLEEVEDEKIVYNLEEAVEIEDEIIPTTDFIKNVDVIYNEVNSTENEEENFNITEIKAESSTVEEIEEEKDENQITFSFDLPLNEVKKQKPTIEEDVNNLEVNHIEDVSENLKKEEEIVHFSLEDYQEVENTLSEAKPAKQIDEIPDEMEFTLRSNAKSETTEIDINETEVVDAKEVSPLDLTISELKKRGEERREKLRKFNYKFNNKINSNIEEIEKEPAYKRMGVELNNTIHSSENIQSRTTLEVDDNDDIQLRSNNSFLHDNVD